MAEKYEVLLQQPKMVGMTWDCIGMASTYRGACRVGQRHCPENHHVVIQEFSKESRIRSWYVRIEPDNPTIAAQQKRKQKF